jgi:hypothetical protein
MALFLPLDCYYAAWPGFLLSEWERAAYFGGSNVTVV